MSVRNNSLFYNIKMDLSDEAGCYVGGRPLRQTSKVPLGAFFVAVSSKTVHGFCGHFRVNPKSIWASVACKPRNPTRNLLRAKNTPTVSFLPRGEIERKAYG